jgi:hypothetical protein
VLSVCKIRNEDELNEKYTYQQGTGWDLMDVYPGIFVKELRMTARELRIAYVGTFSVIPNCSLNAYKCCLQNVGRCLLWRLTR